MAEQITIAQLAVLSNLIDLLANCQLQTLEQAEALKVEMEKLRAQPEHAAEVEDVELAIIGIKAASNRLDKAIEAFSQVAVGGDENAQ